MAPKIRRNAKDIPIVPIFPNFPGLMPVLHDQPRYL